MPLLYIAVPLAAVVAMNLTYRWVNRRAALWVAAVVSIIQIGLSALNIAVCLRTGGLLDSHIIKQLSIDFLSAVVLFTVGLIVFVTLIVAGSFVKGSTFNFANIMLLIMVGMNGLSMVTDLFSLYVFIEVTSAASFILIGLNKGRDELEGAFKYYLVSAVATILMLSSISLIFMCAGSTDFASVGSYISGGAGKYPYIITAALILYTSGLLIKSGILPFHFWVADAYSSAPAPVSVLLAGIVTKASGVYAVMRLFRDVFMMNAAMGNVLIILGLASIVAGAFAAIGQSNMKRMLAYSSISQIGYIILGIGIGSPLGFIGALFHFFNHATFKSLLFVDSAAIEMQAGTTDMNKLGGIAEKMPITGVSSVLGFLSTAGIPPFSGFWSKLLIIIAAWQVSKASAVIALLAGIVTLGYLLVLQKKVFFGKPSEEIRNVCEVGGGIKGIQILLSAINVAAGLIFPLVLLYFDGLGMIGG